MAIEVVDIAHDLQTVVARQRVGIDARSGHDNRTQPRHLRRCQRVSVDHAPEQMSPYTGSADADDAYPFVLAEAELRANCLAVRQRFRVKSRHIPGKVEV